MPFSWLSSQNTISTSGCCAWPAKKHASLTFLAELSGLELPYPFYHNLDAKSSKSGSRASPWGVLWECLEALGLLRRSLGIMEVLLEPWGASGGALWEAWGLSEGPWRLLGAPPGALFALPKSSWRLLGAHFSQRKEPRGYSGGPWRVLGAFPGRLLALPRPSWKLLVLESACWPCRLCCPSQSQLNKSAASAVRPLQYQIYLYITRNPPGPATAC